MLALAKELDLEARLRLALIDTLKGKYDKAYDLLMYTVQHMETALDWTCLGVYCLRMEDYEEADSSLCQANIID